MSRLGLNLPKNKVPSPAMAEEMKKKMSEMQKQLELLEDKQYEGTAGNIKVVTNGKLELVSVDLSEVSDEMLKDRNALQDLILVASNNALKQAIDEKEAISSAATEGLNINIDGLF